MDGEVESIVVKKRALQTAAAVPGVRWIVDRLRVKSSEHMEDGAIRDHVVNALLDEPAFVECGIGKVVKGADECMREPAERGRGAIRVAVDEGVVTLDGEVPTRAHQRLADVLAWWVPGTRDVVDLFDLASPEEDNDEEIVDAVRTALEKDPFVEASQIRVSAANGVVTLTGLVPSDSQRNIAEQDAWYVSGVADVVNSIEVE